MTFKKNSANKKKRYIQFVGNGVILKTKIANTKDGIGLQWLLIDPNSPDQNSSAQLLVGYPLLDIITMTLFPLLFLIVQVPL